MNGERLFRILGLVDEDLVEEASPDGSSPAAPGRRSIHWRPLLAAAACLTLVCGVGLLLQGGSGKDAATESGSYTGIASDSESIGANSAAFMSYAGPVFPLTVLDHAEGLTVTRTITWDLTPQTGYDGSPRQWGAQVSDAYLITNTTDGEIVALASYPFAGSFADLEEQRPTLTVNGAETQASLSAGAYAGGFRDAGVADGSTWNLAEPSSWTDYRQLLEDGSYLADAFGKYSEFSVSVTVYSFTDFQAPEDYDAATQAISFDLDPDATTILSYGFNGLERTEDGTWQRFSYFVPGANRREETEKLLIVLGEDIEDYTLAGYEDGGCDAGEELEGVSCSVTRRVTTLDDVLEDLCRGYIMRYENASKHDAFPVSFETYRGAVAELLVQHGILAGGDMKDRYSDGRLGDMLYETMVQDRVLYLTVPVAIPAGETVELTASLWKAPSHDYDCSHSAKEGAQGYDLVTQLGSTLTFTAQTAALTNTENIELLDQNFGFDLENGITEVSLDPSAEHYYLEIRPKD